MIKYKSVRFYKRNFYGNTTKMKEAVELFNLNSYARYLKRIRMHCQPTYTCAYVIIFFWMDLDIYVPALLKISCYKQKVHEIEVESETKRNKLIQGLYLYFFHF